VAVVPIHELLAEHKSAEMLAQVTRLHLFLRLAVAVVAVAAVKQQLVPDLAVAMV
jgi:hypothetical protein